VIGVYVRVRAAGEDYALPVDGVLEVTELRDIAPVPGSAPEILGVHNLRGQVIPVVDLGAMLGLDGGSERQRVVVVEGRDARLGLAVDSVVDVGGLPSPSEGAESEYLTGAALVDGQLVGIVDLEALLGALVVGSSA
jgi:purine-binding chemotaxis protein CheW